MGALQSFAPLRSIAMRLGIGDMAGLFTPPRLPHGKRSAGNQRV